MLLIINYFYSILLKSKDLQIIGWVETYSN